MHRSRRLAGVLGLLLVGMLALVVVPVAPAAAGEPPLGERAGSGHVEGTEIVNEAIWSPTQGALCQQEIKSIYGLRGVGTYKGRTASGQDVVYTASIDESQGQTGWADGPMYIEVENTETYYLGPAGTYGNDPNCSPHNLGAAAPAEFRIFVPGHVYRLNAGGAQGPCVGHGSFARGDSAAPTTSGLKFHAEWSLDADCTVVGNGGTPGTGTAPAASPHTLAGTHEPCFGDYCPTNIRVDYVQYLPFKGLHVAMGGPDSAQIGTTATVAARITNDGQPLPNVGVTFSVEGPTPAAPPGGAALTDADGRASLTFTADTAGDYAVTASVTRDGTTALGRHVVQFVPPPPPTVVLDGPSKGQTDEDVTVTATFTNAGTPQAGTPVAFSVAGPPAWQGFPAGQPSPASGSAITDQNGKATFTFSAGRAGDHTVTASTSTAGVSASDTHVVHLDIKSFEVAGRQPSAEPLSTPPGPALMDPAGRYAFFGSIQGFDLNGFQPGRHADLVLGNAAVIAPAGDYAYYAKGFGGPEVGKVDLRTLQQVGAATIDTAGADVTSAVIDPTGRYAYFGTWSKGQQSGDPGRVLKVDLATFQQVGSITLPPEEKWLQTAVMDPAGRYAYFGSNSASGLGRVVKIDLATFQRIGSVTLDGGAENQLYSAVIDPKGDFAYFGTNSPSGSGRVVKVDLRNLRRVGAITPDAQTSGLFSAVMDPAGRYAYFGADQRVRTATGFQTVPSALLKVDLEAFRLDHTLYLAGDEKGALNAATIDPAGSFAYFGKAKGLGTSTEPAKIVKVAVAPVPAPWLAAAGDAYPAIAYGGQLSVPAPGVLGNDRDTGDGDPLTAGNPSDPAHGRVALNPDGSFTYTPDAGFVGTDTFTYVATDDMDNSAPATVSVTLDPPQGLTGSAFGYSANVSLFGGPAERRGFGQPAGAPASAASPSVSLPAEGSPTPISAHDPDGATARYGPAVIFGGIWPDDVAAGPPSGPLTATTQGTTAGGGSVTSSAKVGLHAPPVPVRCTGHPAGTTNCTSPGGMGPGPLVADEASSTCTANKSGVSASASFVNGVVETKHDATTQEPIAFHPLPSPLPAGYTVEGTLDHVGDSFRIVFNEQTRTSDGSLVIVNAAHMHLLGPNAVGEVVIGQSVCGAPLSPNTAPQAGDDSYTTVAGTPLTVVAPGLLTNDADPDTDPLAAGSATAPANGTVTLADDGSFTYTPDPGFAGTDTFTYTADDGFGGTDTATVTITVTNAAPVAGDDTYTTAAGTPLTVPAPGLLGNDTDADGHAVTAGSASDPAHGAVTAHGDGSFTYTPDAGFSGTDTFTYAAADPYGATDAATVTITVPPPPPPGDTRPTQLSVGDISVTEGTTARFTVTRAGSTTGPSTVKYKTGTGTATAGSDYTPVTALTTLAFGAGETTKTVDVAVAGDSLPEANETFTLTLASPTGAVLADASAKATILNDDGAAYLAVESVTVAEANVDTTATFRITRTGNTTGASSVKYKTTNGTAGADDFAAVGLTAVTFAEGETFKDIPVTVKGDTLDEKNETFTMALSAPTGATVTDTAGTATIVDDDGTVTPGPTTFVSVDNVLVNEGGTGATAAVFTVTRTGDTNVASTVKYKTSGGTATAGSDYAAITTLGTLSFAAGETSQTVTVDVAGDGLAEADETFNLTLSGATGAVIADASGTATIVNDDGAAYLAVDNIAVTEGNEGTTTATFTVTRTGNTTGASSVKARTSGGTATAGTDYTALGLTDIAFAAGETTKTVNVTITGDSTKEANETLNLLLSTPVGATTSDTTGTATITNDD